MNIHDHIPDDTKAEGQWFKFDGAEFLIACMNNGKYERRLLHLTRKTNQAELKAKPEIMNDLITQAMADAILLDWKGVNDGDKPVPATLENRLMLLRKAREFREWVTATATEVANFRKEAMAADAEALKSGPPVES